MSAGEALHWHWEVEIAAPLAAASLAYLGGLLRLWRAAGAGRGISVGHAVAFTSGMLSLVVALCSPLADLSEQLFSAHMVVHEVLMAVAAPLLVAAHPWGAFAWALPAGALRLSRPVRILSAPLPATLLQAVVIWFWHIPPAFRSATENETLHVIQHVTFIGSALLFWQAMSRLGKHGAGAGVGYLFFTALHTGFLGALLMLPPRLWFPASGGFGLSPLEDQQLAGAIMWMPGGLIYAALALLQAWCWINSQNSSVSWLASNWRKKTKQL